MSIIQGSNIPIKLTCREDMESKKNIHVMLYNSRGVLKRWNKEDLNIEGNVIFVPLTQEETASFEKGVVSLELKWENPDNVVVHAKKLQIDVVDRKDKVVIW